ncbi:MULTISPECIES: DUF983 domain-containing protein [unclassified Arcicella]|uniref:DUF983 domain-containing protein n=1 Tax=unclassified Arcicella TaxID=2644986 RepID=UPI002858DDFC|nr:MULTISPECIES: DUF983 domain-containing protein [unclassified Arcicella]MDR6563405.1 uncharacterized protein (DUF983 family) [Arcicella sp. BE51]MDR6813174.1 uncharacterized protein (DUF983 family) [Arcicella sp. BE140]MDR6824488.1 uncharacterized protein (DUF983 family) [Arcicella sp. BE139]
MEDSTKLKLDVKHSRIQAIIEAKCPQCREGKMFMYPFWQINKFDKMHDNCPVCNLRFEVEPGFWYGAMFISYGINVGFLALLGVAIFFIFNDPPILYYIIPITVLSLAAVPFNFRASRSIFIHLFGFVKYKPR